MPFKPKVVVDLDDVIRRYRAGESAHAIGASYGLFGRSIQFRLEKAGEPIRGFSEAQRLRFDKLTPDERREYCGPLGRAGAGVPKTRTMVETRAATIAALGDAQHRVGVGERELAGWLRERGLDVIPQHAIGRYNVDLAVLPIAVEILIGGWSRLQAPHRLQRLKNLSELGVPVVYVVATSIRSIKPSVTEHIVRFRELAQADPATPAQYWVIRGTGQLLATGRGDLGQSTLPPPTRGANQFTR